MERYQDNLTDSHGNAIGGALVTVTTYPGDVPATIYATPGGPVVSSVTTDVFGYFVFYAANGHYSLRITGAGFDPVSVPDVVLFDPNDDVPSTDPNSFSVTNFGAVGDGVTVDQVALVAAVASAKASNAWLYWPARQFVSDGNIPDFNKVKHYGPGQVKRGAYVFYVDPREGQESVFYVDPAGVAGNDGLSPITPTTFQGAFDALTARGFLDGTWRVKGAAGTYLGAASRGRLGPLNENESLPNVDTYKNNGIVSKNAIVVEGPDVGYDPATNPWPIPTAIMDAAGAAAVGLALENISVYVKNMKFVNFNGSSSSGGVIGDKCDLRTENVHTSGCFYGVSNFDGNLEMRGGWVYGSPTKQYTGVRSLFKNKHSLGSQAAGAPGQGPRITFCDIGVLAQEGATGHSDSVTYEDCTDAIRVTVNSRVNYSASEFKRCSRGIRFDANSVIFAASANFYDGTADACAENIVQQVGGVDAGRDAYTNGIVVSDYLGAPVTVTGSVVSVAILAKTLTRSRFAPVQTPVRKPQSMRFSAFGSMSGVAGAKQLKLRLGGTIIASITNAATDTGPFRMDADVLFISPTSQAGSLTYVPHLANSRCSVVTAAVDMRAADQTLQVEVQLTNAADSVTFNHCMIEVIG